MVASKAKKETDGARQEATGALGLAESNLEALRRQWEATTSPAPFHTLMMDLQRKKVQYEGLPAHKQAELAKMRASIRERQLALYLDGFEIKPGQIPGIGRGRCVTLAAYGIETAADVSYPAVIAVPGFGDATAKKIVAWATEKARGFQFDASKGIDPRDMRRFESDFASTQRRLEGEILTGKTQLEQISARLENARASLAEPVDRALRDLAMAQANVRAL